MDSLNLSLKDLAQHVVKFGIDIFPPVDIQNERTRLNLFYEEANARWGDEYEKLESSDTEFKISKTFHHEPHRKVGHGIPVQTFVLTNRGPVFAFPIVLPPPVGATKLTEKQCVDRFREALELFRTAIPNQKIMRMGMVREVVFNTGSMHTHDFLASQKAFCGADLVGGNLLLQHRDKECNIRLQLQPVQARQATQLAMGQVVNEPGDYGLAVTLDVNNAEVRPLDDVDITSILERADSLWPNPLLEYLKERSPS